MADNTGRPSKYKPRQAKPKIPNDKLDAVESRDVNYIPDLEVDRSGEMAVVRVGKREIPDEDGHLVHTAVTMMPILQSGTHQLKLYYKDKDGKLAEAAVETVEWVEDIIDWNLFNGAAGQSRWTVSGQRKSAFKAWLMFIWEYLTQDELPQTTASSKKRRQAVEVSTPKKKKKKKGTDTSADNRPLAKLPPLKVSESANTSTHRAYNMWQLWLFGEFNSINDKAALIRLQEAYTILHGGGEKLKPPIKVLQAAYKERVERGAFSSELTQAWTQFRELQTGSDAKVILNTEDIGHIAVEALEAARSKSTTIKTIRLPGPEYQTRPDPLPTVNDAWQILREWEARGRDEWDDEIHTVRAARHVVELDTYEKVQAQGGSWFF